MIEMPISYAKLEVHRSSSCFFCVCVSFLMSWFRKEWDQKDPVGEIFGRWMTSYLAYIFLNHRLCRSACMHACVYIHVQTKHTKVVWLKPGVHRHCACGQQYCLLSFQEQETSEPQHTRLASGIHATGLLVSQILFLMCSCWVETSDSFSSPDWFGARYQ